MSWVLIMSPSMPVTSVIAVTFRVPSDSRVTWMIRLTADGDLLPDGALGQIEVRHRHHRVEAIERVARAVGVDRRQAAVVAGVHRLQHVERFVAPDLADDDAIRTHTQGVDHEVALPDRALAFDVGRPRLEPDDVALPHHQLGGVLDRDDALEVRDEAGEHVEQRRLAGAGAARHDDVQPAGDRRAQEIEHRLRHRLALDEVVGAEPAGAKPPNRERRAVDRERRDDRVDARAVPQARVDHRARLVDAAADGADDALDDLHQVPVVPEDDVGQLEPAVPLDVDLIEAVDEDVRDVGVAQQRLRAVPDRRAR